MYDKDDKGICKGNFCFAQDRHAKPDFKGKLTMWHVECSHVTLSGHILLTYR